MQMTSLERIAAGALQPFSLFRARREFDDWHDRVSQTARDCERWIEAQESVDGFCECCCAVVPLKVSVAVLFGTHPNLREGMMCPRGLNNRGRLLLHWLVAYCKGSPRRSGRIALFETNTPLYNGIVELTGWDVAPSDYVAEGAASGTIVSLPAGRHLRHEDITASSYPDGKFQIVVHNDVLEHVPDFRAALADNYRILEPDGILVFTTPFFIEQDESKVLARAGTNGCVEQLVEPPEYHGDPVRGQILTYYRFGWALIEAVKEAGFRDAGILLSYNFFSGLTSCNNPYSRNENVPPLAVVGVR